LSPDSEDRLVALVKDRRYSLSRCEFLVELQKEVVVTAQMANDVIAEAVEPASASAIAGFMKKSSIPIGNAKRTQAGHLKAVAEVRNAISFAVAQSIMSDI
jgi:hypothetical protein